jgi:glycosyltransferase involved in cell wall biosynthesis
VGGDAGERAPAKAQVSWYNRSDLEMESRVNALDPWFHKHVCHYLYGENSLFHTVKSTNCKKKIFVSFHQPPETHQQFVRSREPLKAVDGIVVVGSNQIPFFSQFMDPAKIHFVPHGVDIDYFRPDRSVKKQNKILFVGNWLRDFDVLISVSRILVERAHDVVIDVVTLERNRPLFNGCGNILFHSGIPEDELLRKYQEATLLLVPMKDCTANNSVLEGMACGLPVVTTDIGGIRDYVDEDSAVVCEPANIERMAGEVLALLQDKNRVLLMGNSARKKAEEFSWQNVSFMMRRCYEISFECGQ